MWQILGGLLTFYLTSPICQVIIFVQELNYDGTSFVVPIDAASEALVGYNINNHYKQSIILGYPMAIDHFDIILSTISSKTNIPSNQVPQDDWTVILEIESVEGIPYQTTF